MRNAITIGLLIFLLGYTITIVESASQFVCTKDFCSRVDCAQFPNEETCDGQLVPHSSTCGCCSTCRIYISDGCECSNSFHGIGFLPQNYQHVCYPDSRCVDNVCVPNEEK